MPNRSELFSCVETLVLSGVTTSTGAAAVTSGTSIDCQGFDSAHFAIHLSTDFDATATVALAESDDNSTFAVVPAADVIGADATPAASVTVRVAYVGKKRYVKPRVTTNAAQTMSITAHRGYADRKPTANPA